MEWNLESALRGLNTIEQVEGVSVWWKLRMGWNHFSLMWDAWDKTRERELTGEKK